MMRINGLYSATEVASLSKFKKVNQINSVKSDLETRNINKLNEIENKKAKELNLSNAYKSLGLGNFVNITA